MTFDNLNRFLMAFSKIERYNCLFLDKIKLTTDMINVTCSMGNLVLRKI